MLQVEKQDRIIDASFRLHGEFYSEKILKWISVESMEYLNEDA